MELSDYEMLADHAVTKLVNDEVPLNESIVKIAAKNDMNPEQIKRVVEMVNTKAFLKMFQNPKNKEKNIEFDIADPKEVLGKTHGGSVTITKVTISKGDSSDSPMGFGHTLKEIMQGTKTASEDPSPLFEDSGSTSPNRKVVIMRLRKVASNLRDDIMDKEAEYIDGIEGLTDTFRKMYAPDFGEFEKEATLALGAGVSPILNTLRSEIKWTKDPETIEKVAGVHVVTNTPELDTLTHIFEAKKEQVKLAEAVKLANQKIEALSA